LQLVFSSQYSLREQQLSIQELSQPQPEQLVNSRAIAITAREDVKDANFFIKVSLFSLLVLSFNAHYLLIATPDSIAGVK